MGAAAILLMTLQGCAALMPERAPLDWRVEQIMRQEGPTADDVRWAYTIVIENPGRQAVTLFRETVQLNWDKVSLSPDAAQVRHVIPSRAAVRIERVSTFQKREFQATSPGSPGRPPDAPLRVDGMWIYWQFLGRYEDGHAIILNVDVFPGRRR